MKKIQLPLLVMFLLGMLIWACRTNDEVVTNSLERAGDMARLNGGLYVSGDIKYSRQEDGIKLLVTKNNKILADLFIQGAQNNKELFQNTASEGDVLLMGHVLVINDAKSSEPTMYIADWELAKPVLNSLPVSYAKYSKSDVIGLGRKLESENSNAKLACVESGCTAGTISCSNSNCSVSCAAGYIACCKCNGIQACKCNPTGKG